MAQAKHGKVFSFLAFNPTKSFAWLLQVIGLSIAYFVTGKLGAYLAIPPGYATAIWPPSGIALAGVLIYGYRVWPGILLGSFLVNFSTTLDASPETFTSVVITLIISCGASFQAVAGKYLVGRFANFPNALTEEKEVFLFLLFGGFCSALVNSSIAVSTLMAAGRILSSNFLNNWATWWLGDVLGIFIFTPLALIWVLKPSEPWRNRRMAITLPIVSTFLLTTAIVFYETQNNNARLKLEFDQHAAELSLAVEKSISNHINVLRSLGSFYEASSLVSRQEFQTFVTHALDDFQGIQALSWNPRILLPERETFEHGIQNEGYPNFQITERNAAKQLTRAQDRPEYVAVGFIEPYKGNENALGFDVYSDKLRREAIDRARDTGEIAITARIKLVQERGDQYGALAFMPLYRKDLPHNTLEERRSNILGYLVAVFRGGDIVSTAIKDSDRPNLSYKLIDETAPVTEQLLFASSSQEELKPFVLQEKGLFGRDLSLVNSLTMNVGGRLWRLEVVPTQDYFTYRHSSSVWLILLAGLMLTSLAGTFFMVSSGRESVLRRLVDERAAALTVALHEAGKAKKALENVLSSATQISIIATTPDGVITIFNHGAELMLGYGAEEMIGKHSPVIIHLQEEITLHAQELSLELGRPISGLEVFWVKADRLGQEKREWTYVRKDKSTLIVSLAVTTILDENGEITGYLSIAEDISERKQNEAIVLLAKNRAEALAQSKSEFLANMSHEIRTPMNAIIGLSYLALNKEVPDEVRNYLEKINSSSNSLLSILNDILDFSRLEVGRLTIEHSSFDLYVILDSIRNLFADHAAEKGLDFNINVEAEVPRFLLGDGLRLKQILVNLVGNAIKFTEQGDVTLEITLQYFYRSQAKLSFYVIDTGIGISDRDCEKLFQPFSQVDGSITRRFGGSGLGLAISHNLLKLMGGELAVESTSGKGSIFSFELILGISSMPTTLPANPAQRDFGKLLAGTRILVVEDNPTNQQVIKELLNLSRITVEIANNGAEVMGLLDNDAFDAVLMDMHMPEMDGFEATKLIRNQARFINLPIIALTAGVTQEEQQKCMALGMNGFIAKPINPQKLMSLLVQLIKPDEAVGVETGAIMPAIDIATPDTDEQPILDLNNLLLMINDNRELATRLLFSFMENTKGLPDEVEALVYAGDFAAVKELLHKIKGSSGNIGAMRLHSAAEALETEFKAALPAVSMHYFRKVFDQTVSAISALHHPEQPAQQFSGNAEASRRIVAELDLLLKKNDFIPESVLASLKPHLSGNQLDWFNRLRKLINKFEYAEARKILHQFEELSSAQEKLND